MKFILPTILFLCGTLAQALDLYPEQVGYEWTYQIKKTGSHYSCKEGLEVAKVIGTMTIDDRVAFQHKFCGYLTFMQKEEGVVNAYSPQTDSWYTFLGEAVDGNIWYENDGKESEWMEVGDYNSSLGTLHNCFNKVYNSTETHEEMYCEGVGMVHQIFKDTDGNGWEAELVKKNF